MSNINQIFGTVLLSLILLMGSLYAFAQDEEDEEDPEQPEEQQEEQDNESKDEDSSNNDDNDSKDEDDEEPITNETLQATAQQIIEAELDKAGITSNNESQPKPIVNLTNDHILNPQPVNNEGMQFDATCNCTTKSPEIPTQQPSIMQPSLTPQNNNVIQQIPITSENIKDFESQGKVVDPAYTGYYTVSNLFDNKVDDVSYWSQAGNSGFLIQLDETINDYQVCSMELVNIPNPRNTPFVLNVFVEKNYTGVIDSANEQIKFDTCVKNMNQILLIFNPENAASTDFISVGEVKLFGNKLGGEVPPTQPPTVPPTNPPPPTQQPYKNATKVNISNSDALIDIKNSTITFKFDPRAAQATDYSVITIPNSKVVN